MTKGYVTYTCTNCGKQVVTEETNPLGHYFTGDGGKCTLCGKTRAELYTFDISQGSITIIDDDCKGKLLVNYGDGQFEGYIDPSETITVTGSTTKEDKRLCIQTATSVKIKAENLTINNDYASDAEKYVYAMALEASGANVTLILEGTNSFAGGMDKGSIVVNNGSTLTIEGTGAVTAKGGIKNVGADIGGDGNQSCGTIIINSGTVEAIGGPGGGAGIGASGTFKTTDDENTIGNAIIRVRSIADNDDTSGWSGIIFEGTSGTIYVDGTLNGTGTVTDNGSIYYPLTVTDGTASGDISTPDEKIYGNTAILTASVLKYEYNAGNNTEEYFSITADEAATASYQWYKDSVEEVNIISGATGANYTTPDNLNVGEYSYTCKVTYGGNTLTSNAATVTVGKAASAVLTAPTAKTGLVYNGNAQALVTEGTATNGTM